MKWGKDRAGNQRYKCKTARCGKTFSDRPARPLGAMRLPTERAILCLNLIIEGMSIRATERVTGTHRDTICKLVVLRG